MGELGGFLRLERVGFQKRDPSERVHDYRQYFSLPDDRTLSEQGGRCMDCGVPFCQEGCPLGNKIPDWNDLVYGGHWRDALIELHATNNFPEFTGLICPAPCESACVLDINDDPVTIEQIELAIVTRGFDEGWIAAHPPDERTGRTVGVIGSGPAGLAVAAELNRHGHEVVVYERDEGPGGMLRFGVPDAKLEKWIIDRRVALLEAEGIAFEYGVDVGRDLSVSELRERHDAVVVAIGSRVHRDLDVPGHDLDGVHFAMEYLYQRNRHVAREEGRYAPEPDNPITAAGKRVVVVGGGDTGMDCISNALRENARDVLLLDVYPPLPADGRPSGAPWPLPPKRTPSTYALDEGGERRFGTQVTAIVGRDGQVGGSRGPSGARHLVARPPRGPGERVHRARRPGADRDRLQPSRARRRRGRAGGGAGRARQREGACVRDERERGVRLWRRPRRPVARGHRDRRGQALRARGRPPPGRPRRDTPRPHHRAVRLRGR